MVAGIVAVLLAPQMPLLTGLPALAMAAVTPLSSSLALPVGTSR